MLGTGEPQIAKTTQVVTRMVMARDEEERVLHQALS